MNFLLVIIAYTMQYRFSIAFYTEMRLNSSIQSIFGIAQNLLRWQEVAKS